MIEWAIVGFLVGFVPSFVIHIWRVRAGPFIVRHGDRVWTWPKSETPT